VPTEIAVAIYIHHKKQFVQLVQQREAMCL
jgi:hypothetical protein